jgi:uncharacterized protein YecE (DUF72 family)
LIRIGISGWLYPSWRRSFYPEGLAQKRELAYASRIFSTIEVNGTFYSLKTPASFRRWHEETPEDFLFALKGSRYITHMLRLGAIEQPLATYFAQGVLALGKKLGPILWQLPAQMPFDEARLERFLAMLPRDTPAAERLARKRSRRILKGRALLRAAAHTRLRHALEVRHPSFEDKRFITLMRRHGVALVVSDAPDWPRFEDVTADFVYIRLHGAEQLYASGYDAAAIDAWAARIRRWAAGREPPGIRRHGPPPRPRKSRDVFVYFDNDAKVGAPADARALAERLGLAPKGEAPESVRRAGKSPQ